MKVLIVYGTGSQVSVSEDDEPHVILQGRCDEAMEEYKKDVNNSVFVLCGGLNKDVPVSLIMKNYLISRGIDETKILIETRSKNDIEMVINSFENVQKYIFNIESIKVYISYYSYERFSILLDRYFLDDYEIITTELYHEYKDVFHCEQLEKQMLKTLPKYYSKYDKLLKKVYKNLIYSLKENDNYSNSVRSTSNRCRGN